MNNSNTTYKRLGDYIREVDVRNRDLQCTNLLGLSIAKTFIPSIANTVGTDFRPYKIVKHNQFAYVPVTSRNGDKITVALHEGQSDCIISQAYTSFEIKEVKELLPEYLMMWFRRPEFDRYARFKSHGSAREVFDWEEMCNVMLPIPSLEEQQRIVDRYNAIQHRIATNKQTIAKLEEAAQALYRKMFVDNIDPENLPEGWRMGCLTDIAEYFNGLACQNFDTDSEDYYPVLKIRELGQGHFDNNSNHATKHVPSGYIIHDGDIIFSWSATLLVDFWCGGNGVLNQHLFKVTPINCPKWFAYFSTQRHIEGWKTFISAKATSMGHIKREDLEIAKVVIPDNKTLVAADEKINPLVSLWLQVKKENKKFTELLSLLMVEMG